MKDEEALKSHRHEWVCQEANAGHRTTINALDAYAAGYRAGLARARTWHPLTEDPATWPEVGQVVLLHTPHGGTDYDVRAWDGAWDYLLHEVQWMPSSLPPPKGGSDGR